MLWLRSIIFNLGLIIATLCIATTALLLVFFPLKVRYWYITRWSAFIIYWAKLVCQINYQVSGLENLPKKNAIVLCKHQSAWETLFLQILLPCQTWVLKKELLWIPFFGWALALLSPIAINRAQSSSIRQLIQQGSSALNTGRWVVIFPEGTRVNPGETKKYSRSGAGLAMASGFPIIPIAHNAGHCWRKNSFLKTPGTIQVVIGSAIYPKSQTLAEMTQQAQQWIDSTSAQLSIP
jgi:1-acyl-sn-glycerol-3-phosphate acyltransferase